MHPVVAGTIRTDESGAIAPLFALSLFALVALAGVGFDVGRMYAMDSELQNAADQAALAAATQLDGASGSINRAKNAANTYFATAASAYVNETRFASGSRPITSLSFKFFDGYDNDAVGNELDQSDADSDTAAKIVEVTVNGRRVYYALTPIVDAFTSGDINAAAMAGVQSATCKVPPLMICAPSTNFPQPADKGKGVLMQGGAHVGFWEPGDFGYLDLVGGGADGLRDLLGSNGLQDACISNDGLVDAQPGNIASAPDALNTVFDIYPNSPQYDCKGDGSFCPVANTRKDLARTETWTYTYPRTATSPPANQPCTTNPTNGSTGGGTGPGQGQGQGQGQGSNTVSWTVSVGDMTQTAAYHLEGFGRDLCHYADSCGRYGDASWGRDAYVNNVHAGNTGPYSGLTTRYDIYKKEVELGDLGARKLSTQTTGPDCPTNGNQPCTITYTNVCAYPQPLRYPAYAFAKDRRVMTVAAVDCSTQADANSHSYRVLKWVDIFLVEPSITRSGFNTNKDQIYGEVIGVAERPGGGFGFQYYGRNKAVLIR